MTDEVVKDFLAKKPLQFKGNPKAPIALPKMEANGDAPVATDDAEGVGDGKMTKNQLKKMQKLKELEEKKAQKAAAKAEAKSGGGREPAS